MGDRIQCSPRRNKFLYIYTIEQYSAIKKKKQATDTCNNMDKNSKTWYWTKLARSKTMCTIWFHLYETQENANLIHNDGKEIPGYFRQGMVGDCL